MTLANSCKICSLVLAVAGSTATHAEWEDVIDPVADLAQSLIETGGNILENPVTAVSGDIVTGVQTVKGATLVNGEVEVDIETGNIVQKVGGEKSHVKLNVGSVNGGAQVTGGFHARVRTADITQKITSAESTATANIGSISK